VTFSTSKAARKLVDLAKTPFDLTEEGNLTPQRIEKYCATSCGYNLLYGTERVADEVMQSLKDLAVEAHVIDKMNAMQAGALINRIEGFPSENREVLHTATRDFFEHPNQSPAAIAATKLAKKEVDKLEKFIEKIDKEDLFTDLILIGIGGSELGPKANYLGMKYLQKPGRKIFFLGNVDPDDGAAILREVDLKKCLVLVISKSGTTLETLTNESFVKERFIKAGLDPQKHFVAITGEGSPMDDKTKYLESFYIWDWIGGRYSSTSMVGGVLLSFACGFDNYWEFLKGASGMDKVALNPDINQNISLLSALLGVWNRNFLHLPTLAVIPYSQALSRFPAHIQQLDMESNGKHIDKQGKEVDFDTGPIIWGEPGTSAQHSFYQLIHQGTSTIPLEFIGFKTSQYKDDITIQGTTSQEKLLANLFAQAIALATGQKSGNPNKEFKGNRPSHIVLGDQLTAYSLGVLLAFFEHKVAFQGFLWNINSFDQEGVQLGKVLANKIIDRFSSQKQHQEGKPYPLGDAFIKYVK